MSEILDYSNANGISPSTLIQRANCGGGSTWRRWQDGASPTLRVVDRLRSYMAANPGDVSKQ